MKNAKNILIFLVACNFGATAQESFSATPETVVVVKPADFFVFYNYTQFENLTDDTLQMRWVKTEIVANNTTVGHGQDVMGNWTTAIQDPNFFHNPADGVDSADFYLPPVTGVTDKFILQLFPNDEAGTLLVRFKFFPVNNPADSLIVTFDYTATAVVSSTTEPGLASGFWVYPNPTSGQAIVYLPGRSSNPGLNAELTDMLGNKYWTKSVAGNSLELSLADFPSGIYLLTLFNEQYFATKRIVLEK